MLLVKGSIFRKVSEREAAIFKTQGYKEVKQIKGNGNASNNKNKKTEE